MNKLMLLMLLALFLSSCNQTEVTSRQPSNQAIEITINKDKNIQELKDEKAKLTVELQAVSNLIKQKELERVTFWSKLVGGIALGLATLCLVASFFLLSYPIIPAILRVSSYILAGVGFLAFTVSYIYPWLMPIGFGVLFVILVVTGIMWFRDRKSLTQVVKVIEDTKHHIPNYKDKFRQVIDTSSDKWINKIRGK